MIDEEDIILMDEYTPTYPAINEKEAYKYSLRVSMSPNEEGSMSNL